MIMSDAEGGIKLKYLVTGYMIPQTAYLWAAIFLSLSAY